MATGGVGGLGCGEGVFIYVCGLGEGMVRTAEIPKAGRGLGGRGLAFFFFGEDMRGAGI